MSTIYSNGCGYCYTGVSDTQQEQEFPRSSVVLLGLLWILFLNVFRIYVQSSISLTEYWFLYGWVCHPIWKIGYITVSSFQNFHDITGTMPLYLWKFNTISLIFNPVRGTVRWTIIGSFLILCPFPSTTCYSCFRIIRSISPRYLDDM